MCEAQKIHFFQEEMHAVGLAHWSPSPAAESLPNLNIKQHQMSNRHSSNLFVRSLRFEIPELRQDNKWNRVRIIRLMVKDTDKNGKSSEQW